LRPHVDLGGERQLLAVVQLGDLHVGLPSANISCSCMALPYSSGTASLTACSSTAPRPTRWSMTRGGTRPGRNPGTRTCLPTSRYAWSRFGLSSSNGTSTVRRTRVGLSSSTSVFTPVLLLGLSPGRRAPRRGQWGDHARLRPPSLGQMHTAPIRPGLVLPYRPGMCSVGAQPGCDDGDDVCRVLAGPQYKHPYSVILVWLRGLERFQLAVQQRGGKEMPGPGGQPGLSL